jgi:plasmid maintenance system antidote protein VapI
MNLTTGQAVNYLRQRQGLRMADLAEVLNIRVHLLSKVCRDQKELSFLMALRLLKRFDLSVEDFVSMLSEQELNRTDLTTIRYLEKEELRWARSIKLPPLRPKDVELLPGKDLAALVMGHIQEKLK